MTYRQPTHSTPEPKKPRPARANTDFQRPDAARAAQGAPAQREASTKQQNDARHGYSQDAGYATSGGYRGEATGEQRTRTSVSEDSETAFDQEDERPETD